MTTPANNAAEALRRGIRACREDRWREGFDELTRLAREREAEGGLPGFFYGYLGQAIARCEGRKREGLDLCRHAVQIEPFRPENHLNLAQMYVMVGNRRGALRSLRDGLALDSDHRGLLELQRHLGVRRRPPIPFLARTNPLNVIFGQIRHRAETSAAERRKEREEEARLDLKR